MKGDAVTVPACELADGLNSPVQYDLAEGKGPEPHDGGVLVGDVYCIDRCQGVEESEVLVNVDALWGSHFGGYEEGLGLEFFPKAGQWRILVIRLRGPGASPRRI